MLHMVQQSDRTGQAHLSAIATTARALDRAQAKVQTCQQERDSAVRAALRAGVPRQAIADAAGVHLRRVHQIRDGGR